MTIAIETLIIGAGPAGLATAATLKRKGLPFRIVEAEQVLASSWRNHYDRLHLHTAAQHSHLPYERFPPSVSTYPSRAEVVTYLEDYARKYGIEPIFGQRVESVDRNNGQWIASTTHYSFEATNLVVATGYNSQPKTPQFKGLDTFPGSVVHSSSYRNGAGYFDTRVLVVGFGNSGAEIALDLFEAGAAHVDICIRGPVHVMPRDVAGVPAQVSGLLLSKLPLRVADRIALAVASRIYNDEELQNFGIQRPRVGPVSSIATLGKVPMIDVGTIDLIRQNVIGVVPGIQSLEGDRITFVDGRSRRYDHIIMATGYDRDFSFFASPEAIFKLDGLPRDDHEPGHENLFFVGFRNPPTGQLHDIAQESRQVADLIHQKSERHNA